MQRDKAAAFYLQPEALTVKPVADGVGLALALERRVPAGGYVHVCMRVGRRMHEFTDLGA